jgi:hypothetical protein
MSISQFPEPAVVSSSKVYGVKSTPGALAIPAGQYKATADSEWTLSDESSNVFSIPAGESVQNFRSPISALISAESSKPTRWYRGTSPSVLRSPLGLINDGANWVAANSSSRFLSTTNGKDWTQLADLGGSASIDDAPRLVSSLTTQTGSINTGQSKTYLLSSLGIQAGDRIFAMVTGNVSLNSNSSTRDIFTITEGGYTSLERYIGTYNGRQAYVKTAVGSESTLTVEAVNQNISACALTVLVVRNASVSNPSVSFNQITDNSSNPSTPTASVVANSLSFLGISGQYYNGGTLPLSTIPEGLSLVGSVDDVGNAGFVDIYSNISDVNTPSSPLPSITFPITGVYESNTFSITFDPVVAADPISCFTYADDAYYAFKPHTNSIVSAANPPVSWSSSGISTTVSPEVKVNFVGQQQLYSNGTNSQPGSTVGTNISIEPGDLILYSVAGQTMSNEEILADGFNLYLNLTEHQIFFKYATTRQTVFPRGYTTNTNYYISGGISVYRNAAVLETNVNNASGGALNTNPYTSAQYTYNRGGISIIYVNYYSAWLGVPANVSGYTSQETHNQSSGGSGTHSVELFTKEFSSESTETFTVTSSSADSANRITNIEILPVQSAPLLEGLIYANDLFIGYGPSGLIMVSSDGLDWIVQYSFSASKINKIIFENSRFLAVTGAGEIFTSPNGVSWAQAASNVSESLVDIVYSGGLYSAVSISGTVVYSSDASTWTVFDSGSSATALPSNLEIIGTFGAAGNLVRDRYEFSIDELKESDLKNDDLIILSYGTQSITNSYVESEIINEGWKVLSAEQRNVSNFGIGKLWYKFYSPGDQIALQVTSFYRRFSGNTSTINNGEYTTGNASLVAVVVRGASKTRPIYVKSSGSNGTNQIFSTFTENEKFVHIGLVHSTAAWTQTPQKLSNNWNPSTYSVKQQGNADGSYAVFTALFENGGTPSSGTLQNNGDVTSSTNIYFTSSLMVYPAIVNTSLASPEVVGLTASYPYVVASFDTGSSAVYNLASQESFVISSSYPGVGGNFSDNIEKRSIGFTEQGLPEFSGNILETLMLETIGDVTNAN